MSLLNDITLLEKADFIPEIHMTVSALFSSLDYLRTRSRELGISIEEMTTEQIIADFAKINAETVQLRKRVAEFPTGCKRKAPSQNADENL